MINNQSRYCLKKYWDNIKCEWRHRVATIKKPPAEKEQNGKLQQLRQQNKMDPYGSMNTSTNELKLPQEKGQNTSSQLFNTQK